MSLKRERKRSVGNGEHKRSSARVELRELRRLRKRMEREAMERQLVELDALRSTWPEPGSIVMCRKEQESELEMRDIVACKSLGMDSECCCISYTLKLPELQGCNLRVSLPRAYPISGCPTMLVDLPGTKRSDLLLLQKCVDECKSRLEGCESVHACVLELQEFMEATHVPKMATCASHVEACQSSEEELLSMRALWFHHIYARGKRKSMSNWSRELNVGGWCLVGKPGVVVIEGTKVDVDEFIRRVKSLRWQAVSERYAEDGRCGSKVENRCLPMEFEEISPEEGFAGLVERCKRAEVERVLTSLIMKDT